MEEARFYTVETRLIASLRRKSGTSVASRIDDNHKRNGESSKNIEGF